MSIAPLTPDGLQLAGPATDILRNDLPWEGHVIEVRGCLALQHVFRSFCGAEVPGRPALFAIVWTMATAWTAGHWGVDLEAWSFAVHRGFVCSST